MPLTPRQEKISDIVRASGPITGEQIAERLNVTRAALRPDLAVLVMSGLIEARPKVGYYYTGKDAFSLITDQVSLIKVRDIQSVPVVVSCNTSAYDAVVTMFLEDVGTVFAVEPGGILAGVISRKDVLKIAIGGNDLHKMPVKVLMTPMPKIVVTTPDEPVLAAAKKIIDNEVDSLPVVSATSTLGNKVYEVVGRLTKTNVARLFVELGEGKGGNNYS
ncbi:MAG TPA: helix-turn-helix transcriptional regulator [Methylomusa anaerophila]|uniref:Transcriptional repressor CcpN n=1 Tax=Methylomusa anaerophila TaxID=1930071 RepID=A0A348AP03_9FIRM|nr:helix-turn-helix transcriptional regulator [Methylomusa anaerophila]BBB92801.1 transcriptional repressor CcpN [Methylomusa anaerophila]HML87348.1 helix-turn-helix transcriptional regulator [Methylomusa anaerophila]